MRRVAELDGDRARAVSGRRSTRCAPSTRRVDRRGRGMGGRDRGCRAPRPRLRATAGERRLPRRLRVHTPTELLDAAGALSPRFTAVHATHVTAADIERLATTGSRCCICPTTERELADGIGPTAALRGPPVSSCASGRTRHAVIDPFEETRAVELDERLASLRRGTHHAGGLLTAAIADRLREPRLARRWHAARRRPRRLRDGRLRQPAPRRIGSPRRSARRRVVRRRAGRRRVTSSSAASTSSATEHTSAVDVVAALEQSISAAWAAVR